MKKNRLTVFEYACKEIIETANQFSNEFLKDFYDRHYTPDLSLMGDEIRLNIFKNQLKNDPDLKIDSCLYCPKCNSKYVAYRISDQSKCKCYSCNYIFFVNEGFFQINKGIEK